MEYVTIQDIQINTQNKEGKPYVNKKGYPYCIVAIKTVEHPGERLSGFSSRDTDPQLTWKQGDRVLIVIEKNGEYLNFKVPTKTDIHEVQLKALNERVKRLEATLPKPSVTLEIPPNLAPQTPSTPLTPAIGQVAKAKWEKYNVPQATQQQVDHVMEVDIPDESFSPDEIPF